MEKIKIRPNPNNDLKFMSGISHPSAMGQSISEKCTSGDESPDKSQEKEKIEYFTE